MKGFRKAMVLGLLAAVVVAALLAETLYIGATRWHSPNAAEVEIRQGMPLRGIAQELARQRVIRMPRLFESWARLRGVGRTLRAGTYEFPAGMTLPQVLGKLARGEVKQYPFTVVEGWTIREIAAALEGQPFLADPAVPQQLLSLALDPAFVEGEGFEGERSLEGFLFPDTYLFSRPATAEQILRRLTGRFREVWSSLDARAVADSGLTRHQVVTLASIVEKETGAAAERPLIAAVFFNRLRQGMPLQSDPTTIYGLPGFDGNLHKQDMSNPHPYNTYVHAGLPPGPICSPGKAAIEAVLRPATTDALYFVARGDGTHQFSASLSEHAAAVQQYQVAPARAARNR